MNLSLLTDSELKASLLNLSGRERAVTLSILHHLIELERRALFREEGFSSLFSYCVKKLRYSDASAQRRILAARALRDNPSLGELFLKGEVTLCAVAAAAKSIRAERLEVKEIVNKSRREVEALVSRVEPVTQPKESIKPIAVQAPPTPLFPETPPAEERFCLKFSVTKEVYQELEEAKNRLSNSLKQNLSLEAVLAKLLEHYLKPKRRERAIGSSKTRHIPRSVRRAVYERDKGACAYVAPDGRRCGERRYLHFDHVKPFSLGGKTEASNLRLLCAGHNQHLAQKCFGNFRTPPAE
jgi:hypothetical protein